MLQRMYHKVTKSLRMAIEKVKVPEDKVWIDKLLHQTDLVCSNIKIQQIIQTLEETIQWVHLLSPVINSNSQVKLLIIRCDSQDMHPNIKWDQTIKTISISNKILFKIKKEVIAKLIYTKYTSITCQTVRMDNRC